MTTQASIGLSGLFPTVSTPTHGRSLSTAALAAALAARAARPASYAAQPAASAARILAAAWAHPDQLTSPADAAASLALSAKRRSSQYRASSFVFGRLQSGR